VGANEWVSASQIFTLYVQVLNENKRRIINRREFNRNMAEEGFEYARIHRLIDGDDFNGYAYLGISLKPEFNLLDKSLKKSNCDNCDDCDKVSTQLYMRKDLSEKLVTTVTTVTKTNNECGNKETNIQKAIPVYNNEKTASVEKCILENSEKNSQCGKMYTGNEESIQREILEDKISAAFGKLQYLETSELLYLIGSELMAKARFAGLIFEFKPGMWSIVK